MATIGSIVKDVFDNTASGARGLGSLSKAVDIKGSLNPSRRNFDPADFYRFRVSNRSSVSMSVDGMKRNVDLILYDQDNKILSASRNGGKQGESMTQILKAGLYYVKIGLSGKGKGTPYNFSIAAVAAPAAKDLDSVTGDPNKVVNPAAGFDTSDPSPITPPDPGNTPATAFDTGALTATKVYRNNLGGGIDNGDFYRFSLAQTRRISATIGNLAGGDVKLNLIYDANNNGLVDENDLIASSGANFTKPLAAGTYFVGVIPGSLENNISYDLKLETNAITNLNPNNDPGKVPGTAYNFGGLNGSLSIREFVGSADLSDLYRFTLPQTSGFKVDLQGLPDDVALTLIYDVNANGLIDSGDPLVFDKTPISASDIKTLGKGTYFLRVEPKENVGNAVYDLTLAAKPLTDLSFNTSDADDPGSSLGTAKGLALQSGTSQVIKQFVGSVDSADVYRFTVDSQVNAFKATLSTAALSDNITMALVYDRNGDGIMNLGEKVSDTRVIPGDFIGGTFLSPGKEETQAASITRTLGQGTYFLVVNQQSTIENTVYNLDLFTQSLTNTYASADPSSNLGQATSLLINGSTYSQFVGSTDASDVYQFTIGGAAPQNVLIKVAGLADTAEIRLAQDKNGNGLIDSPFAADGTTLLTPDQTEVFEPGVDSISGTTVLYSPLPPYASPKDVTRFNLPIDNAFVTNMPTDIYARLNPGTYYIEIERAGYDTDLGDGVPRTGHSNTPYTLTLLPA